MAFWAGLPAMRNRGVRPCIHAKKPDRVFFLCFAARECFVNDGGCHACRVRLPSKAVSLTSAGEQFCGCHTGGKSSKPIRKTATKGVEAGGDIKVTGESFHIPHHIQKAPRMDRRSVFKFSPQEDCHDTFDYIRLMV